VDWEIFIPLFLFGTISGSFLNVIIYRIPEEISIVSPRSFCPHCKSDIPFYRNIPLITFLFQGGKCSTCQKNISLQYPTVEFLSGIIWGWSFSNFTFGPAFFITILSSLLLAVSWIDMRRMIIPLNLILIAGIVVVIGVALQILPWQKSIYGSIVGPISFGFVLGITYLISKRQAMGYGDIQLSAVLGAWQGPLNILFILFFASFLSLLVWIIISILFGFDRNRALPFAPFLVVSAITIFVTEFYMDFSISELFMWIGKL
jgi:leader peptidase (prepilin peptidase)/N-methyltransferase